MAFFARKFGGLIFLIILTAGLLSIVYGAETGFFEVSLKISKSVGIKPDEKIEINFSQAVITESYKNKIRIMPAEEVDLQWANSGKTLILSPKNLWEVGKDYAIFLEPGKSKFFATVEKSSFTFSTIKTPAIKSVVPSNGSRDVVFDIEDPIVVDFNETFEDFWINFKFNPPIEFAYQINPEKTQFKIIPKSETASGAKYAMTVNAKYIKDTDAGYRSIFSTSFETLPPEPKTWEQDFGLRIEQAKKFTRAKIKEGKYIDINLASQIMTIFEAGKPVNAFLVSSGKRGMDTPKGSFKIENKAARPWSATYGLYMPNWMAIVPSGKYGIHELPEWPGGYKEGASHLGTPVSHGCVRLGVGSAKSVYDWAEIGTPVVIY